MLNFARRKLTEEEIIEGIYRRAQDRFFSRTEPWSSLGFFRRAVRIGRIIFGFTLFSALTLAAAALAVCGASLGLFLWQIWLSAGLVPYLATLAWCVGCMVIWRGVYAPHRSA